MAVTYSQNGVIVRNNSGSFIKLKLVQGSRSTPSQSTWPTVVNSDTNRLTTQVLYFDVGTRIHFSVTNNKVISLLDGTKHGQPFQSITWTPNQIDCTVEYGVITIAIRNNDNSDISPSDCELFLGGF